MTTTTATAIPGARRHPLRWRRPGASGCAGRPQVRRVLHLVAPRSRRTGYEIIKALSELVSSDSPSPGTVYPTLAMLEDLGWVGATRTPTGAKEYAITAEGQNNSSPRSKPRSSAC